MTTCAAGLLCFFLPPSLLLFATPQGVHLSLFILFIRGNLTGCTLPYCCSNGCWFRAFARRVTNWKETRAGGHLPCGSSLFSFVHSVHCGVHSVVHTESMSGMSHPDFSSVAPASVTTLHLLPVFSLVVLCCAVWCQAGFSSVRRLI